jgi:hypothetical protein
MSQTRQRQPGNGRRAGIRCYHGSMPSARRFPPPWTIDEANNACFIVRDNNGQALRFEDEPGRRFAGWARESRDAIRSRAP